MIWEARITISSSETPLEVYYFVSAPVLPPDTDIPCYGIGISAGGEAAYCTAFCPEKEEAIRVCSMLCQHQVTPVSFYEVLDDYLAAR